VFLDLNGWIVADPAGELFHAMLGLADESVLKRDLARLLRHLAEPDLDTER
jgi:hypothetical protein